MSHTTEIATDGHVSAAERALRPTLVFGVLGSEYRRLPARDSPARTRPRRALLGVIGRHRGYRAHSPITRGGLPTGVRWPGCANTHVRSAM